MWIPWRSSSDSTDYPGSDASGSPWWWSRTRSTVSGETAKSPTPSPLAQTSNQNETSSSDDILKQLKSLPPEALIIGFAVGSACGLLGSAAHRRYFRRIRNAHWVTPDIIAGERWIRGYVTRVGDADNFRLYHTPTIGWRGLFKFRHIPPTNKELRSETIHVRLAGVDAPEASHFGLPAQEGAKEAKDWLTNAVLGKFVYCQLLHKDQYSRVVADVYLPPRLLPGSLFYGRSLSIEFLRTGLVEIYTSSGAVYGRHTLEEYKSVEEEARLARRGLWKDGKPGGRVAEYKRKHRELASSEKIQEDAEGESDGKPCKFLKSMFKALFGR